MRAFNNAMQLNGCLTPDSHSSIIFNNSYYHRNILSSFPREFIDLSSINFFFFPSPFPAGEGNGTLLQYSCLESPMDGGAWKATVHGIARSQTRLSDFTFTFHFRVLEKEMATHSSVLAWRVPETGEPSGLPSMGSHRVGCEWSDLAAAAAAGYTTCDFFQIVEKLQKYFQYIYWKVCM